MQEQNEFIYKNPGRSPEERTANLIELMTLEEKIAQISSWWHSSYFLPDFEASLEKTMKDGLGVINWLIPGFEPEKNVQVMNRIQRYAVERTRLGIPVLFTGEALAGGLFYGATYFPTAIGLASTWDPELIREMCRIVRRQMYAYGVRLAYSPVVDIARDPRWGRIGETYGEDPYLASVMGTAFVKAMQGEDLTQGLACTAKHFLGYAAGEGGINKNVVNMGPRELYEIYARPFEALIRDGGVKAVMNAYSVIDNVPVAGSREILTHLLKEKLGFNGAVFSDAGAIQQLVTRNRAAGSMEEAAIQALTAGIDLDVSEPPVYTLLKGAVEKGLLDVAYVNRAAEKILTLKFELGLFEHPYADGGIKEIVYTAQNHAQARKTAVKSMVLLKNEGGLLPLSPDISSVAVIGPNAGGIRCFFGGYSSVAMREIATAAFSGDRENSEDPEAMTYGIYGDPGDPESFGRWFYPDACSLTEAICKTVSEKTGVTYTQGCRYFEKDGKDIEAAVEAAKQADVVVMALGGVEGMGGSTTCGEGRDRMNLKLPGYQQELLEAVWRTGKRIVLVVISSNPLDLSWAQENVPAILQAWSPGQAAGEAIADVLFGLEVPGGKLPLTIPRDSGQIPLYYNRKPVFENPETGTEYVDGKNGCLYPFGHGLSYTEFEYGGLEVTPELPVNGEIKVSFEVRNTGQRTGEEVAQVYIHDCAASVSRPVMELVGFCRIRLEPGEKVRITCTVKTEMLAFYNDTMDYVIEPGVLEVMVGSSSADIRQKACTELRGQAVKVETRRVFSSQMEYKKL